MNVIRETNTYLLIQYTTNYTFTFTSAAHKVWIFPCIDWAPTVTNLTSHLHMYDTSMTRWGNIQQISTEHAIHCPEANAHLGAHGTVLHVDEGLLHPNSFLGGICRDPITAHVNQSSSIHISWHLSLVQKSYSINSNISNPQMPISSYIKYHQIPSNIIKYHQMDIICHIKWWNMTNMDTNAYIYIYISYAIWHPYGIHMVSNVPSFSTSNQAMKCARLSPSPTLPPKWRPPVLWMPKPSRRPSWAELMMSTECQSIGKIWWKFGEIW